MKRRKRVNLTCATCGKVYWQHEFRADTSKYCSRECWANRRTPNIRICPQCNKPFDSLDKRKKYCSHACSKAHRHGKNASSWKDGKSLERDRARLAPQVREWRTAVFKRDGYACQDCGQKGLIHAHHIKPWAKFPDLRFDVSNGKTLCIECHGLVHGKDFSNRRTKICPVCGIKTTGTGVNGICRSCSLKRCHHRHLASLAQTSGQLSLIRPAPL